MKSKFAVVTLFAFAAGFAAGLFWDVFIAPARAAEDRVYSSRAMRTSRTSVISTRQ